jgi:signal transduction histidine kinase
LGSKIESEVDEAFLRVYNASGLTGAFYVAIIGGVTYLAFTLSLVYFGEYTLTGVALRGLLVVVLFGSAAFLWLYPDLALSHFQGFVGLLSIFILGVTVHLVYAGPIQRDYSLLGASSTIIFALLMHYSFLRISVFFSASIGVGVSSLFFLGVAYDDVDREALVRSVIYFVVCNLAGIFLRRNDFSRERSLYLAREGVRRAEGLALERAAKAEFEFAERARLLNAIEHDLRQPLAAAAMFLGSAQRQLEARGSLDAIGKLDGISDSIRLIQMTLDHIRSLSTVDRAGVKFELEDVSLRRLFADLRASLSFYADRKGVELSFEGVDADVFVRSKFSALSQVLVNIVSNAIKYSAAGGCSNGTAFALVSVKVGRGSCAVRVVDNGVGMARGDIGRIWEPYTRLAQDASLEPVEGVGLGLYLVKQTLARLPLHGVSVRSRLGRGTVFKVSLPLVESDGYRPQACRNSVANYQDTAEVDVVGAYAIVLGVGDDPFPEGGRGFLEKSGVIVDSFPDLGSFLIGHALEDRVCDILIVSQDYEFSSDSFEIMNEFRSHQQHLPVVVAPVRFGVGSSEWCFVGFAERLARQDLLHVVAEAAARSRRFENP